MLRFAVLLSVLSSTSLAQHYLSTDGQHFKLNGQRVFLSGLNMAWCQHGYDFGGGAYNYVSPGDFCPHPRAAYEQAIRDIRNNGGNSLRVWLHVDGRHTPVFSSWGSVTQTDSTNQLVTDLKSLLTYGVRNLYSDQCLRKAGGFAFPAGVLDFYQIHTYAHGGTYGSQAPFVVSDASDYTTLSDKPVVIGEFSQTRGGGMTIAEQFERAYSRGYAGAWSWHYLADRRDDDATDSTATQLIGLRELRFKNDQTGGGCVRINLNGSTNLCENKPTCFQLLQYFYG